MKRPAPLLATWCLLFLAFVLSACAHAQITTSNSANTLREVREMGGVTELALPNGLQVLLAPDATSSVTSVNITYRVGSRHEALGEHGAAHLLEHMLFKASGSVADPKREMGARAMRWNGTTSDDRTNYFASFGTSTEKMQWMLSWLAGMMSQARFTRADLDSEMSVVRNEWERSQSNPGSVLAERMRQAAYQWHGYGRATIGARSDIENISIERLYSFYRQYYRPDNATLIISGQFDAAAARSAIEQHFGPIAKPASPLPRNYTLEEVQDGERQVTLRRAGGLGSVAVLYHMPAGSSRAGVAAAVLAQVLTQRNGPLQRGLVGTNLAVTEYAYYRALHDPGYLVAGVGLPSTPEGASATQAQIDTAAVRAAAGLAAVLENLQITDEEFALARQSLATALRAAVRETEGMAGGLSSAVALGDWRLLFVQREWLQALQADEVRDVARRYLLASNRTTGRYLPLAEGTQAARAPAPQPPDATNSIAAYAANTPATSQKALNSEAVKPADDPATASKRFEAFELSPQTVQERLQRAQLSVGGKPGVQVAVLPRAAKDDRVQGVLRLRWGTLDGLQGSAVLATMLGPLLLEGAQALPTPAGERAAMNGNQIRNALQSMDARLSFSTSAGRLAASFEYPAGQHAAFMALLTHVLRAPSLDAAAFERNQKAMLASLQGFASNTANVAGSAIERSFHSYPEGDVREARDSAQTAQLTRAATAEQLRAHWQRFAGASHGEMVLIGPVELSQVQAPLQAALGDWVSKEPMQTWARRHASGKASAVQALQILPLADKSNASYSARIALAMTEQDADLPALSLGVQLLSRTALWQRVREREGLSYSVGASLQVPAEGDAASINLSASFAPSNLERLRSAMRTEVTERRDKGFSESDINQAKAATLTARREAYARVGNTIASIANNLQYQRPMTHEAQRNALLEAVQPTAVNAALKKYLQVEQLVEVAAGSFTP
jgi:zinc protease